MNETENYLLHKRSTLAKSIPAGFIIHLIGAMTAFGLVFAFYSVFCQGIRCRAADPVVYGKWSALIRSLCLSQSGNIFSLLLLFLTGFTICSKGISFLLCLWRGASLGCAAALLSSGCVISISGTWHAGLLLSFLATVLFILLTSYVTVYSDCILRTFSMREYRYTSSLIREYCLCFLTLSGAVLSAGILSVLLI